MSSRDSVLTSRETPAPEDEARLNTILGPLSRLEQRIVYERYQPLVHRISRRARRAIPRAYEEDVEAAGWLGLVDAYRRRTAQMTDEEFEHFASCRVRGAILDFLRKLDPLPRRLRRLSRRMQEVSAELRWSLGRAPQSEEIAARLGITLEEYREAAASAAESVAIHYDEGKSSLARTSLSPEAQVVRSNLTDHIATAIDGLPERLRTVVRLYYRENQTLRQIGEVLGLTESRVSQLNAEALERIRKQVRRLSVPPRT